MRGSGAYIFMHHFLRRGVEIYVKFYLQSVLDLFLHDHAKS